MLLLLLHCLAAAEHQRPLLLLGLLLLGLGWRQLLLLLMWQQLLLLVVRASAWHVGAGGVRLAGACCWCCWCSCRGGCRPQFAPVVCPVNSSKCSSVNTWWRAPQTNSAAACRLVLHLDPRAGCKYSSAGMQTLIMTRQQTFCYDTNTLLHRQACLTGCSGLWYATARAVTSGPQLPNLTWAPVAGLVVMPSPPRCDMRA